ncbi:MAG TPA: hypothetical protein OIM12_07325 [Faecalibacterium prausnitzii]|nr:hypothetical protein [Faecalibacterium prausnitzii]
MSWILVARKELLFFAKKSLVPPTLPENRAKKKTPESFELENNSGVFNTVGGGKPVLCLQKGILSPSCLPAFGKFDFRSLYRLISHCERDFSSASERDSHFFDKMIVSHFPPYVNHVKLFHLVMLDLRSVRDPGRSPCPDALLGVGDDGLDNGLVGVLMDGIEGWVIADFWRLLLKRLGLF